VKTIAWDVDDVLNDLMRRWLEDWWLPGHPGLALRYEEILENPPHRLLGTTEDEYLRSLDEFRLSDIAAKMVPVPEVLDWFKRYGRSFRHIALTARPAATAPPASQWVFTHFGEWIRTFHFVPAARGKGDTSEYDKSKGDYLSWLGKVDVLVDDRSSNIESAKELGIAGVLMPRPWNRNSSAICEALGAL